jgi:hypothetical protein
VQSWHCGFAAYARVVIFHLTTFYVTLGSTLREYDKTGLYLAQLALLGALYARPASQVILTLYMLASAVVLVRVTFVGVTAQPWLGSAHSRLLSVE